VSQSLTIQSEAAHLAQTAGDLLLRAERLAHAMTFGDHGRRKAGLGDHFWQYRPFQNGLDSPRSIDHRRSAKQDQDFVRQLEWKTPQVLHLWVDSAASMRFSSKGQSQKHHRGAVLALALAIAAEKAGERVGLSDQSLPPARGKGQIFRMAERFATEAVEDYVKTTPSDFVKGASAVLTSDFFADLAQTEQALSCAVDKGVSGVLLQVLDPSEQSFPFRGRAIFQSVLGRLQHDTKEAGDLRQSYLDRLISRQTRLKELAQLAGWTFYCDDGSQSPIAVASRLYFLLSRGRSG